MSQTTFMTITSLCVIVIITAVFLMVIREAKKKERRQKEEYDNEIIRYKFGEKTLFFRRYEIPEFEMLSRTEKRRFVARFESDVKKGKYIPVYERGAIIGYDKKQ